MKEIQIQKSETRERRERTLNLPLRTYFTLFITIVKILVLYLIRKDLSTTVPVVNTKYKTQYAGVWKEER